MLHKAWYSIEELPYYFFSSSIKFPGHMGPKINDLNPILSKNTRPVAAIKILRFALLFIKMHLWKCCLENGIHFVSASLC